MHACEVTTGNAWLPEVDCLSEEDIYVCWKSSGDPGCLRRLHSSVYSTMQCFFSLPCTIMITLKLSRIKTDRKLKT